MTGYIKGHAEIKEIAEMLYKTKPDWATFYKEMLGLQGVVRRAHPTLESLAEFEQSETYTEIHCMLTELRRASRIPTDSKKSENDKIDMDSDELDDSESEKPEQARDPKIPSIEPTKVITVRIPKCLHDSLRIEAFEHRTSMNKLCISKLVQIIDSKMVPTDSSMESWGEAAGDHSDPGIDRTNEI